MTPNAFAAIDAAIRSVLKEMPNQRQENLPTQAEVWASVKDDPNRLLGYVQTRTGLSGVDLLRERDNYERAMKEKFG